MSVSTLPPTTSPTVQSDRPSTEVSTTDEANDAMAGDGEFTAPAIALMIVVALAPFWAIPVAHVASNPETATGFFQYELPYYVANGRSAFERGNGVLYPNPYDPSVNAPPIYVHWLPWTLGLLTTGFGFDPGDVILAMTFFASLAFACATWRLVDLRVESAKHQSASFLLSMWGGGLLCAAGAIAGLVRSDALLESLLKFDPGQGMWFLNWGRNALFPTEAIYHTLVACCWVAEIRRHRIMANVCLLLLATTHPWSGIELLLTINLWRGVEFLRSRDAGARNQLSISVVAFVAFLSYYKIWLPTFPQHAELQNVWKLNWSLSWTSAAMAYLPVLIPCALQIRRRLRTGEFNRAEQFLLCALFVAAALAFHDRLITPVQPLHFTRGYVWMPMFLLGLPMIIDWWTAATKKCGPRVVALTVVALLLVVSDNLMFAFVHSHRQFLTQDGFHLDSSERALLQSLHNLPETQGRVLLSSSETLNYLMPTYANVRPWLGHHFNTPSFPDRKATWEGCFEDNRVRVGRIPQDVGVLVIRRSVDDAELAARTDWAAVDLPNVSWAVWRRSTASTF